MTLEVTDLRIAGSPLPREFYTRPAVEVAPDLLDCVLVLQHNREILAGRISETEAYDEQDAASHTYCGKTRRNAVMFGPGGHAYVYFTYGMHYCLNAVCGTEHNGEGVLIRALEPLCGLPTMSTRRHIELSAPRSLHRLCDGPAKICQAFGIDITGSGVDMTKKERFWIVGGDRGVGRKVLALPRIGISRNKEWLRRYVIAGDRYTSRNMPTAVVGTLTGDPVTPV